MGKRKLFTAGCSVSTKNDGTTSYPVELAKLLGYELVDLSAGCGSNQRMWRMITKHIMDGNLTSEDILTIQYTEILRFEFYSKFPMAGEITMEDSYDDGKLIRYKFYSDTWQHTEEETKFFKLFEENHINESYCLELFETNNFNFQYMLDAHKIKTIFIVTPRMNNRLKWYISDRIKPYIYYDYSSKQVEYNQTLTDGVHFSDLGHKVISENLYNHILNLKLNE